MIAKVNTRNILIKRAKKTYRADYERQMDIAERSQIRAFNKFLFENYQKGIRQQLTTGSVSYESLFQTDQLIDLYSDLYSEVGLRFAKFYTKEFQHLSRKATLQENTWQELFGHAGRVYAGGMVTLVSGTKKDHLKQVLRRLYSDVEFQAKGVEEQARILNNQFKGYSRNEAIRLVRTESGTAANYATSVAAKDLFDPNELVKEWMAGMDGRERLSHRNADGDIVDFDKPFKVGITRRRGATQVIVGYEDMMYPSDPTASAANRINCRCTHAPFPKEDAEGEKPLQPTINVPSDVSPPKEPQNLTEREKRIREEVEKGKAKATISGGIARSWDEVDDWIRKNTTNKDGLNDEFLEFVDNKKGKCTMNFINNKRGKGSFHHRDIGVRWNASTWGKTSDRVLYHEYGHQFASDFGIIGWEVERVGQSAYKLTDQDDELHAVLLKAFSKWEDYYKNNRKAIKAEFPKWNRSNNNRDYWQAKKTAESKWMSRDTIPLDFEAEWSDVGDVWEAISPNTVGFGHGKAYYNQHKYIEVRKNYSKYHEFMAHAYEVKYVGNEYMNDRFPELHDAMLDMINEMQEIIRKRRGY